MSGVSTVGSGLAARSSPNSGSYGGRAKAGLITRGPDPDDERATAVTLTDDGLALVRSVLPGHIQLVRRLLFAPLTGDDLADLGGIMTRVRDHMRAQPPRSAAPRKRRRNSTRAGGAGAGE
jgi:hypothetical protein